MFQFTPFPSAGYVFTMQMHTHCSMRVPPFGNLRFIRYLLLTAAYRSLSRPSSASGAKASALCSFLLDQLPDVASSGLFLSLLLTQCEMFLVFSVEFVVFTLRIFMLSFVKTCLTVILDIRFRFLLYTMLFSFQCASPSKISLPSKFLLMPTLSAQALGACGGPGWTRTTDLTLIRRAL